MQLDPIPHLEIVGTGRPLAEGGSFLIQRNAHMLAVLLEGAISDEVSDGWRAVAQKSFDDDGYPAFGYVDASRAKVAQSLAARMRSAAFMRKSAQRIKRIYLVSADANVSFVMRTVMRAAGVGNVSLIEPTPAQSALALIRDGKDPFAEGVLTL